MTRNLVLGAIIAVFLGIAPAGATPPRPSEAIVPSPQIDGACARPNSPAHLCAEYALVYSVRLPPNRSTTEEEEARERAHKGREHAVKRLKLITAGGIVEVLR